MRKVINIAVVLLLFVVLASIRFFENSLFYDPLIAFFKGDYRSTVLPPLELLKLMLHTAFRFWLNTAISLGILWFAFWDKGILKFSIYFYAILFCVLALWMFVFIKQATPQSDYQILFYVRRFLIQPVFLLLLLPAFYYHKRSVS